MAVPVFILDSDCEGHAFKLGSAWKFRFYRKTRDTATGTEAPISLADMTGRVMLRRGSVVGEPVLTVDAGNGLVIDAIGGSIEWVVMPTDSVKFNPGEWVFFDVELTPPDGKIWQSPTMKFRTIQQVTTP